MKKYKTTTKQLIELLKEFDSELEFTEYDIERSRIDRDALAKNIREAIAEREKLPEDVAETVQKLAKRAVESPPHEMQGQPRPHYLTPVPPI